MFLRLGKEVDEVTGAERERTKRVVYAVMYGAGRDKLAEVLHITPLQAKDIITSFISKLWCHCSLLPSPESSCNLIITVLLSLVRLFLLWHKGNI